MPGWEKGARNASLARFRTARLSPEWVRAVRPWPGMGRISATCSPSRSTPPARGPSWRIRLVDLPRLRGGWHRFEVHIRWSDGNGGLAEVFIDGKLRGRIAGRNVTAGAPRRNYFKYGLYLHGTHGTEQVTPAYAFYADVHRALTRDGLGN